ncbi:MAG: HD domain-containing protein [Candidatus Omnitrophota bacterium]
MSFKKCPGSQKFNQPQPEIIACEFCRAEVEIWTDEAKATCPKCKKTIIREGGASCLDWCKYAKECVGDSIYSKYMKNKVATLKELLTKEMEAHFGEDGKRINHAKSVLSFAEELLTKEKADWHIVVPASILHDVGIKAAEAKYSSAAGHHQEKEGPAIAKKILLKFGFKKEDIEEICDIIARHHTPGKITSMNFKVLYDADWLVNIKDEVGIKDKDKSRRAIDAVFLTRAGKDMAKDLYL